MVDAHVAQSVLERPIFQRVTQRHGSGRIGCDMHHIAGLHRRDSLLYIYQLIAAKILPGHISPSDPIITALHSARHQLTGRRIEHPNGIGLPVPVIRGLLEQAEHHVIKLAARH